MTRAVATGSQGELQRGDIAAAASDEASLKAHPIGTIDVRANGACLAKCLEGAGKALQRPPDGPITGRNLRVRSLP